jgi:hypothetical protein
MGSGAKLYMTNGLLIYTVWLNICAFPHILGSPSSYMTLHPIPSDFLIKEENFVLFYFIFYQCAVLVFLVGLLVVWSEVEKRK